MPAAVILWLTMSWVCASGWQGLSPVFAQEGEAPAAAAEGAEGEEAHPPRQNMLIWVAHTSGLIGLVILIISIFFIQRVVMLFMELRKDVVAPPEVVEQFDSLLEKRDYNGIYQLGKESDCQLGTLVSGGLAALSSGLDEAREAMDREADAMTAHMEKRTTLLAVIGSLGPMIGLLGTLKGMIASFSVIATSGAQLKASEVAGGISEALLLTFEGVALSVPAIYFFAMFKDRVATLSVDVHNLADEFIRKVHASAKSPAAA